MRDLLRAACVAARARLTNGRVYSVSIWTDPDAGVSAVSIDTRAHSAAHLATLASYARTQVDKYAGTAHADVTELLLNLPDRNINPADFAFANLAMTKHDSFPAHWATETGGECWQLLGAALQQIADEAVDSLVELPLEREAELGINSATDWYTHRRPIALRAT